MRRCFALLATLVLLWAIVAEINHAFSDWHLYVFAGGLFVCHPALTQSLRCGLAVTLTAALVCDAQAPVVFGTHFVLFAAAHAVVFRLRHRIPRHDNVAATLLVLFVNFGLFLGLCFAQARPGHLPGAIWSRLLADLICSQIFVALVTPWFFALQDRALALAETTAGLWSRRAA